MRYLFIAVLLVGCAAPTPEAFFLESDMPDAGDTDTDTDTDGDSDSDSDTDTDTDTEVTDGGSDTDSDSDSDTGTDGDTDTDADSDTDTDSETETESSTGTGSDTDTATDTGTETETESDTDTESDTGSDTDTVTDTDSDTESDSDTGPVLNACGFVTMPAGTVCDPDTGNVWEDDVDSPANGWWNSFLYCFNLTTGGFSDWRMPTDEELDALWRITDPYTFVEYPYQCRWPEWAGKDCAPLLWSDYGYDIYGYIPTASAQVFNFDWGTPVSSQNVASFSFNVRCVRP